MFSEMHYFRSSETWKNQWRKFQLNNVQFLVQVEVFASSLPRVGSLSLSLRDNFRKTNKQTKNIRSQSEYPIRPCLVVVILVVLKQWKEQSA